jgi:hypothetical protein
MTLGHWTNYTAFHGDTTKSLQAKTRKVDSTSRTSRQKCLHTTSSPLSHTTPAPILVPTASTDFPHLGDTTTPLIAAQSTGEQLTQHIKLQNEA